MIEVLPRINRFVVEELYILKKILLTNTTFVLQEGINMSKTITRIQILFLLVIICSPVFSQQKDRIAVLPFSSVNVSENEATVITSLFEIALLKTGVYNIIEQNQIERILIAQSYSISACTDSACAIEIGELLSAEQIIIGEISRVGTRYIANVKIIDVSLGKNINADTVTAGNLDEMTENSIQQLAFKLVGISSDYLEKIALLEADIEKYDGTPDEILNEMDSARSLYEDIMNSGFAYKSLEKQSSQILQKALINRIEEIKALQQEVEKKYRTKTTWQIIGFGTGLAGFATTGAFYLLYLNEFDNYNSTVITAEAVSSREKLELFKNIELGGVIAGGAGTLAGNKFLPSNRIRTNIPKNLSLFQQNMQD